MQKTREIACQMGKRVHSNADSYPKSDYLVEINVVVERYDVAELGSASQPCDGVSADGEEDDGHVELEGLGGAFGGGDAVAHDVEDGAVLVLDEFPGEKAGADSEP